MNVNYSNIEVTSLEVAGLFEAEFDDLNGAFTDERYYAVFTVTAQNTAMVERVIERLDGMTVDVDDAASIREVKRVLDVWLKYHSKEFFKAA